MSETHEYENLVATINGVEVPVASVSYSRADEPMDEFAILRVASTFAATGTLETTPEFLEIFFPLFAGCAFCGQGRLYSSTRRAERSFGGRWARHVCPRGHQRRARLEWQRVLRALLESPAP